MDAVKELEFMARMHGVTPRWLVKPDEVLGDLMVQRWDDMTNRAQERLGVALKAVFIRPNLKELIAFHEAIIGWSDVAERVEKESEGEIVASLTLNTKKELIRIVSDEFADN